MGREAVNAAIDFAVAKGYLVQVYFDHVRDD